MTNALLADTLEQLAYRIDSVGSLADELRSLAEEVEEEDCSYDRGTILKALPNQTRFKPKSMGITRRWQIPPSQWQEGAGHYT